MDYQTLAGAAESAGGGEGEGVAGGEEVAGAEQAADQETPHWRGEVAWIRGDAKQARRNLRVVEGGKRRTWVYVQAYVSTGYEPLAFRHAIVEAESEEAAYDAGHAACSSSEMVNDYVVEVTK